MAFYAIRRSADPLPFAGRRAVSIPACAARRAPFVPNVPATPTVANLEDAAAACLDPAPGKLAGLFGDGAVRIALRAAAVPLIEGGRVVVVDGANRFDPYVVSRAVRDGGADPSEALSRVRVSRAFTAQQFERLVTERLQSELRARPADLLLVLGPHELFRDADVSFNEACRLFHRSVSALSAVRRTGTRVLLAGAPTPGDRVGFFMHLARTCQPMLLLRRDGDDISGSLWSDPSAPPVLLPAAG